MKKILFLDIDGVLNSQNWDVSNGDYVDRELDPLAIERMNTIINATSAEIVITSTWRLDVYGGLDICAERLYKSGLMESTIVGCTDNLMGHSWSVRGNEIYKWIKDNSHYLECTWAPKFSNYVILDDEQDMLYTQRNNFIKINPMYGLLDSHVDEAIKILLEK